MTTAHDVAARLLQKPRRFSNKELQKFLYLAEAHSLAWDAVSLFPDVFEGWVDGPVVRAVRNRRSGGNVTALSDQQRRIIDEVYNLYQDLSETELIDITHHSQPWIESRKGLGSRQPGHREISRASMRRFFSEQEQGFADLFREFGLRTRIERGRIVFVGTRQQAEEENERVCQLLHDKTLPRSKHTLLIQASGRCEYVEAVGA